MRGPSKAGVEQTITRPEFSTRWGGRTKNEGYMTLMVAILASLLINPSQASPGHFIFSSEEIPSIEIPRQTIQNSSASLQTLANNVCLTKGCLKAATGIIERMDESVKPCENFFDFACGGFLKNKIIPDEKSSVSEFSEVVDTLEEKLRLVVEEEIKDADPPATHIVKNLYASCINTMEIEKRGLKPLRVILQNLGGWPVVEGNNWDEGNFSWIETNYRNRKLGYSDNYLFDFSVRDDSRNSTWRMIWFDQPKVGIPREYLMRGSNDSGVQAYLRYMIDSAILLGADPLRAEREMKAVLEFSTNLANISLPREERRNRTKLYNTMTLAELSLLAPDISWVEYVNNLLPSPLKVDKTERIGVSDPNYFTNITKILKETPKRVVANYMVWRVVVASAPYISENIRALELAYKSIKEGKTTRPPRWKECISFLTKELSHGVGSLYVRNFFNAEDKKQAEELVAYVRAAFDEILRTIDWMDDVTRNEALKKSEAIKSYIGFPDELLMDEKLTEYYSRLVVEPQGLLDNMRRIKTFLTDDRFEKLREKVDKSDWRRRSNAAIVNAYYKFLDNSINFPAGILQGRFFEPDRLKYLNYGGIGSVIGHEITHGFDDQGKQYDAEGNLRNWWEPDTEKKFLEKAKCIINQYSNFTAPENGMKLNGVNTQGENIADNGAIKEVYQAYLKWVEDHGKEKRLPGLDYKPLQLFWISNAQIWCSKYRPQKLKDHILTGFHSPGRFRIIGTLSNFKEFSKDWGCPLGSKMNPVDKCQVW